MKRTSILLTLLCVLSCALMASERSLDQDSIVSEEPQSTIITDGSSYNFFFSWKKKKKLDPHWSGIGFSFLNFADNDVPGLDLMASKSYSVTFNPVEYSLQIGRSNWMLVSGLGIDWSRYHFKGNRGLEIAEGLTQFVPAPEGVNYQSSKLLVYYLTVPLLLEFQTNFGNHSRSTFFISAGVVGYLKCYSKSQVKYHSTSGEVKEDKGRDLNINPFNLRYMAQIGVKNFNFVASYSPFSLFEKDKGPDLQTVSFGVAMGF